MLILNVLLNTLFYLILFILLSGGFHFTFFSHRLSFEKINILVWLFGFSWMIRLWLQNYIAAPPLHCLKTLTWIKKHCLEKTKSLYLLLIFFLLYVVTISMTSSLKTYSLNATCWDIAIFSNTLWNTLHGSPLFCSIRGDLILLGDHFNPILLLLAPFYWAWPSPHLLIWIQSMILASGIFPIFWLAQEKTKSILWAFCFVISYLLYPPLRHISLFEFHPEVFVTTLYLYAFYFLNKNDYRFLIPLILSFFCKETEALTISFFGTYMLFFTPQKKLGAMISLLGVFFFIFVTSYVTPHFSGSQENFYFTTRYGYLGATLKEIVNTVTQHPWVLLSHLFTFTNVAYLWRIFRSIGLLSFLSPSLLLMTLPTFFINALSTYDYQHSIKYQYVSAFIPFVYLAAIVGVSTWIQNKKREKWMLGLLLFSAFAFFGDPEIKTLSVYLKESRGAFVQKIYQNSTFQNILQNKNYSVTVSTKLTPLFSTRRFMYQYPSHVGKTDYLILLEEPRDEERKNLLIDEHYLLIEKMNIHDLFIFKRK